MPGAPATTYDELPYDDHVFAFTHPATLATVAALHGLDPPAVGRCRVLELGCAAGANLLPMAVALPDGEFVGLDLSPRQVARGRETAGRLGLTNLGLYARDILAPTDDLGTFDYVICHGVYSWVPPAVQDRILDVIGRQLAADGLAYVSYNVYPGWHTRAIVRDLLTFHTAGGADPATRTGQARAYLNFLATALPAGRTPYTAILRGEAETLRDEPDSYLFHEFLEADNRPVYFHQFAAAAAGHRLQYVAEAAPQPLPGHLPPEAVPTLAALAGDRVRLEQHLDFLRGRAFRRSLLCHAAARPDWDGVAGRLPAFAVSSDARPEGDGAGADGREAFLTPTKLRFTTNDPALRAALRHLWEARPAAVPFADLVAAARGDGPADDDLPRRLADEVLQLYVGAVVELHRDPPAVAAVTGPRPTASPLTRLQAARGDARLHDLRHRSADPDPFARYLLPLLDGTRDRGRLVEELAARSAAGDFEVRDGGGPVTDPARVRGVLAAWVEEALDRLAKAALLTA
ncbi:MAG TPA: class I SAM-dependent methyltransferase [Gemmataceae bacterium]|jgi:SAM-dependent methyltransferase